MRPHSLSRLRKRTVTGIRILGLSALTVACDPAPLTGAETQPPPCPQCTSRALSKSAAEELKFSENQLGLVLAIDTTGKIQAFRRAETHPIPLDFPLVNEKVLGLEGASIFIFNPKFCWKTTDGDKECITY